MFTITSLPVEVLTRIVSYSPTKHDLASLRLTSRLFNDIAVKQLFSTTTLYAHYEDSDSNDSDLDSSECDVYDAQTFKNAIDDNELRKHIRKVDVYTCETHCDHHPNDAGHVDFPPLPWPRYHERWWDCVRFLKNLPFLTTFNLHFDRHSGESDFFERDILHEPKDRLEITDQVLSCLLGSEPSRITHLGIRHYQDNGKADNDHVERQELLKTLSSLRMTISNGETRDSLGKHLRAGDPHTFWGKFPQTFLKPAMGNLQRLVLYSDILFGFFPRLDLRDVHFPNLKSLCFGYYVFAQDSQFDWITSHAATLQELYMDDCSILYSIAHTIPGWLGEDGFPLEHPPNTSECYGRSFTPWEEEDLNDEVDEKLKLVNYPTRWFDIFSRFQKELPRLRRFAFGKSKQWFHDTTSRYGYVGGPPHVPWEAENDLENEILRDRYAVYCDWECSYSEAWDMNDDDEWKKKCPAEWRSWFENFPACDEEDQIALRSLCNHIERR
ncbi:unnamed protein product [Periconia digitata]|uniref:F-box domain-containing protein n=1 Tax=Periconia digitata TaxID=1303443 RepID=A0A9W4XVA9_9PLEO|nr:unnamed protein product [Periconia digitata]